MRRVESIERTQRVLWHRAEPNDGANNLHFYVIGNEIYEY